MNKCEAEVSGIEAKARALSDQSRQLWLSGLLQDYLGQ
jgi:hypothetical protein